MDKAASKLWARIHALAWTDPKFADAFAQDPRKAVAAHAETLGVSPDAPLPLQPKPADVSAEDAQKVLKDDDGIHVMYCC